jgi:alkyl hydroperoxide reductase subunit AhpF
VPGAAAVGGPGPLILSAALAGRSGALRGPASGGNRSGILSAMSLTPAARATVAGRLAGLVAPVRLAVTTRDSGCQACTCPEAVAVVEAVAALSPLISVDLNAAGEAAHAPAIAILGVDGDGTVDYGIRLVGAPVDYELTSLVEAIVTVSTREAHLSPAGRARLAELTRPVHVQVFSTPTCVHCPRAVALAHRFALASPLVSATAYSVVEFPDLIRRHRVTGVPKTVVDTGVELLDVPAEAVLLDAILAAPR